MQVVTARIELVRGIRQVPLAADVPDESPEALRRLFIAGKLPEQAVTSLERGLRAGHPRAREQRGDHAAVRRPAGMQGLDRRAVGQELHHARGLAERNPERGDAPVFARAEKFGGEERRRQRAADRSAHEAVRMKAGRRGEAEADENLPAPRKGAEQRRTADALGFADGERRGRDDRAAVLDRGGVGVVVLQAVDQAAVDERGVGGNGACSLPEHSGGPAARDVLRKIAIGRADRRAGGGEADAAGVEQMQPRGERDFLGQRRLRRCAQCPDELASKGHDLTMPASTSRHGRAASAASPRMTRARMSGTAGNTPPAFSASFASSVCSSNG